jgi:hypothetical protein
MEALRRLCELKPESCGPPTRCLGANASRHQLEDRRMSWSMSARDCVKNAAKNVEAKLLDKNHEGLKSKADRPHPAGCRAETGVTPELNDDLANQHQQLISALRWACELGRIDMGASTSCSRSRCWRRTQPCQGGVAWRLRVTSLLT